MRDLCSCCVLWGGWNVRRCVLWGGVGVGSAVCGRRLLSHPKEGPSLPALEEYGQGPLCQCRSIDRGLCIVGVDGGEGQVVRTSRDLTSIGDLLEVLWEKGTLDNGMSQYTEPVLGSLVELLARVRAGPSMWFPHAPGLCGGAITRCRCL